MRETDDGMARALLPAVVATACALAASAVVYATVALTHAKPHVGDIVVFASAESDAADETSRLVARHPDGTECVLDLKVIGQFGGSLIVETEGQTGGFRVHWAGGHTSAGADDCGEEAILMVGHRDLDILALAAGGYGVASKRIPIFPVDATN